MWLCKCDCGNEKRARATRLVNGYTTHCGCRKGEKNTTHGCTAGKKAGKKWDPLYSKWSNMIQRCENKNNPNYPYYGGRGITVCDEWHDFSTFREDLINLGFDHDAPLSEQTMDRVDNNKPYAPWNIRLVGAAVQSANRREYHPRGPRKAIEAVRDDGSVVRQFKSVTEASKWCGCSYPAGNISAAAKGKAKQAFGYGWRYVDAEA